MFIIYKHTNKKENKSYIGMTSKSVDERWIQHCMSAFGPNRKRYKFHLALRKFGIDEDVWEHEIIEDNITDISAACEREIFWIESCNTKWPNGYNMTVGGQ